MAKNKVTITINGQETNINSIKNAYTHGGVFHADADVYRLISAVKKKETPAE